MRIYAGLKLELFGPAGGVVQRTQEFALTMRDFRNYSTGDELTRDRFARGYGLPCKPFSGYFSQSA
jgi:hypothetical protein